MGEDPSGDIGPENGKRPPFATPIEQAGTDGKIGTGTGYSGQEYDSDGQAAWRAEQERHAVARDGALHGSGAGTGEEIDDDLAGAAPSTP